MFAGYCYFNECCKPHWTNKSVGGIRTALKQNVFGQHLVMDVVPRMIQAHKRNKHPQKPLVLAFHGSTGTGKNYVSGIIADQLYGKGMGSKYVHKFISSHLFPNKDLVQEYKKSIKRTLKAVISRCESALFIIDEVDKMPMGLIDTFKPYVDYNEQIDGYDFRKSMFIFMGNTGVNEINEFALGFFKKGKEREKIPLKQMQKLLRAVAFHSGGMAEAVLLNNHLIDFHVPFLPLERKHIYSCIEVELEKAHRRVSVEKVQKVADELEYFPKDVNVYAVPGCKSVRALVNILPDD